MNHIPLPVRHTQKVSDKKYSRHLLAFSGVGQGERDIRVYMTVKRHFGTQNHQVSLSALKQNTHESTNSRHEPTTEVEDTIALKDLLHISCRHS